MMSRDRNRMNRGYWICRWDWTKWGSRMES